jgi:hypothetical protein
MISMKSKSCLSVVLAVLFMFTTVLSVHAQASMIGTHELIAEQQLNMDRETLKEMLADDSVKERLASMGVSPSQIEQRINSLTAEELAYFNAQLEEAPAGAADVVGVLLFFFVLFVITDMLCATNVFKFVNCINK